jgi:hypothetical protein
MAVSRQVRRLLRVLDLEEEMRRRDLTSAQAELALFDTAMRTAAERERYGRLLFTAALHNEDLRDRLAGQAETHAGRHRRVILQQFIEQTSRVVEELREKLLEKRVERKQAETLVVAAEANESLDQRRRSQQSLDAWYLLRTTADRSDTKRDEHETFGKLSPDDRN